MSTTVRFGQTFVLCDAYLDQGHYVGGDPIGHACTQDAVARRQNHDVCQDCLNLLESGNPRDRARVSWQPGGPRELFHDDACGCAQCDRERTVDYRYNDDWD